MDKRTFEDLPSTNTPINANNLNGMQSDIEKSVVYTGTTQPSTNEKVWIECGKNLYNPKNAYVHGSSSQNIHLIYKDIEVGQTYTFTASNYSYVAIKTYNSAHQLIRELGNTQSTTTVSITIQSGEVYIELVFFSGSYNLGNIDNIDFTGVQLEQGSATTYEQYVEKKIMLKNSNSVFKEFYREDKNKDTIKILQGVWNNSLAFISINNLVAGGIYRISFSYNHKSDWSNLYKSTYLGFLSLPLGLDTGGNNAVVRCKLDTIRSCQGMDSSTDTNIYAVFEGSVQEIIWNSFVDMPTVYINFTNTGNLGDFLINVERIV